MQTPSPYQPGPPRPYVDAPAGEPFEFNVPLPDEDTADTLFWLVYETLSYGRVRVRRMQAQVLDPSTGEPERLDLMIVRAEERGPRENILTHLRRMARLIAPATISVRWGDGTGIALNDRPYDPDLFVRFEDA